jgi:hypothetical protein
MKYLKRIDESKYPDIQIVGPEPPYYYKEDSQFDGSIFEIIRKNSIDVNRENFFQKIEWSDKEIERLENRYKMGGRSLYIGGKSFWAKGPIIIPQYFSGKEIKKHMVIPQNHYNISIYKYNDDWYVVKPEKRYGKIYSEENTITLNCTYLCDQFDGLLRLLDKLIQTS